VENFHSQPAPAPAEFPEDFLHRSGPDKVGGPPPALDPVASCISTRRASRLSGEKHWQ